MCRSRAHDGRQLHIRVGEVALPRRLHRSADYEWTRLGAPRVGLRRASVAGGIPGFVMVRSRPGRSTTSTTRSDSAGMKQLGPIDDNARLRPDAANLAAFLYALRARYRRLLPEHRRHYPPRSPFPEGLCTSAFSAQPEADQAGMGCTKGRTLTSNASSLSDGSLRFICLATLLLQPVAPSVVLLDEPELGLHPAAITDLASLLRRASTRTQSLSQLESVTLVNQLRPEDIVVGGTYRTRVGLPEARSPGDRRLGGQSSRSASSGRRTYSAGVPDR